MKIYTVKIIFGNQPKDRIYDYLTYDSSIREGDEVVVDLGSRRKIVKAVSDAYESAEDTATSWIICRIPLQEHNQLVKALDDK